jgi:hypothetical protein
VTVDSSDIIAILLKEPGYERLRDGLAVAEQTSIGAPTVVESSMVLCARLGRAGKTLLARFLEEAEIEVVELTTDHWTVAADAFILPWPSLPVSHCCASAMTSRPRISSSRASLPELSLDPPIPSCQGDCGWSGEPAWRCGGVA